MFRIMKHFKTCDIDCNVKTIIPSEKYCCNMIIFCKLVKIMIVQTLLCKGAFLPGEAM